MRNTPGTSTADRRVFILDDDPTGAQSCSDVHVLLDWRGEAIPEAIRSSRRPVHVMTNSRAVDDREARERTRIAALTCLAIDSGARIVLRGDSTLRGHVYPEYQGLVAALQQHSVPVLMLVPALPTEGRITLGGVHWLLRGDTLTSLDKTEYAADSAFSYSSARLLDWLEDRSDGRVLAEHGVELAAGALRTGGPAAVWRGLRSAHERGGAFVPDAVNESDLRTIVEGLLLAEGDGIGVVVRCGPTFAAMLSDSQAVRLQEVPPSRRGLLVVCGSYVPNTTAQLHGLLASYPTSLVEIDVSAFLDPAHAETEAERVALEAGDKISHDGIAVVATPRQRLRSDASLEAGTLIAQGLARAVASVRPQPDVDRKSVV